jgi:hypothetical protein
MDLATFDTAKSGLTAQMKVEHPGTGETVLQEDGKTPVTMTLCSADGEDYRRVLRTTANRRLEKQQQRGKRAKLSVEEIEGDAIEALVAATKDWSGIEYRGRKLEFNVDNCRMIYKDLPWLREQVDAFISERANFLGN